MVIHSSILAWEIPWIEEPGSYSPWGHKRVRHDLATKHDKHNFFFELYVLSLQCFKGILPNVSSHHTSKICKNMERI